MNELELINKAQALVGLTAEEIASQLDISLPVSRIKGKGWMGQAVEKLLGATAHSKPLPDFINLGIELKTLSVNLDGKPKESTYICVAPFPTIETNWEDSIFYLKTRKILWVPILSDSNLSLDKHRILSPFLWQPSAFIDAIFKQDWEELTEFLNIGQAATLTAHRGQFIQIRPKAAHSRVRNPILDEELQPNHTVPKGFYLRRHFVLDLLAQHFK